MKFANAQATVYNDTVVRQFAIMTVVWGVVGMLVGVIIAAQLTWPELNFGIPVAQLWPLASLAHQRGDFCVWWLRLVCRRLTTWCSAPAMCACSTTNWPAFTFWGWQLVILAAAISLPMGYTQRQGICRTRVAH